MSLHKLARVALAAGLAVSLSACGGGIGSGNLIGKRGSIPSEDQMTRKERADA
jgi:F0F1-type ATP synthase membrane subunit c/vacuolar-type H+-ATPase subunit K